VEAPPEKKSELKRYLLMKVEWVEGAGKRKRGSP